jgi:hypothetical protein
MSGAGETTRRASCSCGALALVATGEPVRISVCHCLACQQRTGSAFGVQARFPRGQVSTSGAAHTYERISDEGEARVYSFCPTCGATVWYVLPAVPGIVAVPVGAFADQAFPEPTREVYEHRRHAWVAPAVQGDADGR